MDMWAGVFRLEGTIWPTPGRCIAWGTRDRTGPAMLLMLDRGVSGQDFLSGF